MYIQLEMFRSNGNLQLILSTIMVAVVQSWMELYGCSGHQEALTEEVGVLE